jgi:hypothetical protein
VHVDAACQWVVGSVQSVSGSAEQGYTVHVLPETDYVSLLTSANQTSLGGAIPVQVLPGQAFPVPRTGERIAAIGTLSLDTLHSWHTLTPVWAVDYLDRDGQVVTSIPAPVDAVAPGTTPETPTLGL